MSAILLQAIVASSATTIGGTIPVPPTPGSGEYNIFFSGTYAELGTPFNPGGGRSAVFNEWDGWIRKTYNGIWSTNGINDNPSLFNDAPIDTVQADDYGGFGTQSLDSQNYAIEWKGYIQAPSTGNFNFLIDADDVAMFWIGTGALDPDNNTPLLSTNNSATVNANSVTLTQGLYYPVRMRFQEWSGAEKCQVYMATVNGTLYAMNSYTLRNDSSYGGYSLEGTGQAVTTTYNGTMYTLTPSTNGTASPAYANPGDTITWTVTTNTGAANQTLYIWVDNNTVPANTWVENTNDGTITLDGNGAGSFSLTVVNSVPVHNLFRMYIGMSLYQGFGTHGYIGV